MSLAKLTSISTQTLSLLLERQRLETLHGSSNQIASTNTLNQITRNLNQLRTGILNLEEKDGSSEAVKLLKSQFERMRGMLGVDGRDVEPMPQPAPKEDAEELQPIAPIPQKTVHFAPYTDDPPSSPELEPTELLVQQRQLMEDQDTHLDHLSRSINRQRDVSIQINEELDVHTGLLEELDTELDHTDSRLSGARRGLDRFAKGVKGNGSSVTIVVLIVILLILIIVLKT